MMSDTASQIPAELKASLQSRALRYSVTQRPWLDLYGVHVRPVVPFGSVSRGPNSDSALIHRALPDELLFEVFIRMNPYDMGKAACVCRKWKYTLHNPVFWRNACQEAWQLSGIVVNYKILQSKYESSWRKMWLLRPRVRSDGLYVSRNTYIQTDEREWCVTDPVHLIFYYQYMRFYPSGRFIYKNSYQAVKEVVKCMNLHASKADGVYNGHYLLKDDKVEAAFVYPGLPPSLWRVLLRLRGTVAGANNRMDLLSLITSGLNSGSSNGSLVDNIFGDFEGWEDEEFNRCSHKKDLEEFTFVPFEEVETSVLNLPVDKMHCYIPR